MDIMDITCGEGTRASVGEKYRYGAGIDYLLGTKRITWSAHGEDEMN